MTKKYCIIGSAPSSVQLAPYADADWKIFACSPGAMPHVRRVDAWFECHLWEPGKPWFMPDYIGYMQRMTCPVYMIHPVPEIPCSVAYPKDDVLRYFAPGGQFFLTSSVSWMLATAIMEGATHIHLCGVDMSADDEIYTQQRAGTHYFIVEARRRGIVVTTPPQSDLLRPPKLYGFAEADPHHIKMLVRMDELKARLDQCTRNFEAARDEMMFLRGALSDMEYNFKTWVSDPLAVELAYWNPEPKVEGVVRSGTHEIEDQAAAKAEFEAALLSVKRGKANSKANGKHIEEANG